MSTGVIMSICDYFTFFCLCSYLNQSSFVDRDMFMRYRGGGVGHKVTSHLNHQLLSDFLNSNDQEGDPDDEDEGVDPAEQDGDESEEQSEPESEENDCGRQGEDRDASENEANGDEHEESFESDGYADI